MSKIHLGSQTDMQRGRETETNRARKNDEREKQELSEKIIGETGRRDETEEGTRRSGERKYKERQKKRRQRNGGGTPQGALLPFADVPRCPSPSLPCGDV